MLGALLSEEASKMLVEGILAIVREEVKRQITIHERRPLTQSELMKREKCGHEQIKRWEALGLQKRRQGKRWVYDPEDVEAVKQLEKQ